MVKRGFKENKLDYYAMAGISNLTDKHYKIRLTKEYFYELYSILFIEKKHLRFTFHAYPTFKGDKSLPNPYDKKEKAYYTIQVQFLNVLPYVKLVNIISSKLTTKDINNIVDNCEVQFYSDDKSFYWQGFWEDLSKNKAAIYPFKGTNGKGIWKDIHTKAGGLTNPNLRVTKHIEQLIKEFDDIMGRQLPNYLKRHTIKPFANSKVFKEEYSNIEKLKLAQNEKDIREYLKDVPLKDTGFLNKYIKNTLGGDRNLIKEIKPKLVTLINKDYDENSKAIEWINSHQIHIENLLNGKNLFETFELENLWGDGLPEEVSIFLNQLYDIKFLNNQTNSVGKGELLFASILNGYYFNNAKQSDLINEDGELIEIKSNMGKFSGSKRFDAAVNSIGFTKILENTISKLMSTINYRENLIKTGKVEFQDDTYVPEGFWSMEARPIEKDDSIELYNNFADWMNSDNEYCVRFAKTLYKEFGSEVLKELFKGAESNDIIDLDIVTDRWFKFTKQFTRNATGDSLKECFYRFLCATGFALYGLGEFKTNRNGNFLGYIILCNKKDDRIKFCIINVKAPGELFYRLLSFALHDPKELKEKWGINFTLNLSKGSRGVSGITFRYNSTEEIFGIINSLLDEKVEECNEVTSGNNNIESSSQLKKFRNGKEWVNNYNDYLLKDDKDSEVAIVKNEDLQTSDFEITLKSKGEVIDTLVFQIDVRKKPGTLNIFYKDNPIKISLSTKSLKKSIRKYIDKFFEGIQSILSSVE